MLEPDSIRFNAVYSPAGYNATGITGKVGPPSDGFDMKLIVDSAAAVKALQMRNPDTGGQVGVAITGRFRYGSYSVPFQVRLLGPVSRGWESFGAHNHDRRP